MKNNVLLLVLTLGLLAPPGAYAAPETLTIVANANVPFNSIPRKALIKVWKKRLPRYQGSARLEPIDQVDADLFKQFASEVLGSSYRSLWTFWKKEMFKGQHKPPKRLEGDDLVLSWVRAHNGAIAYVTTDQIGSGVKIITVTQ